MNEAQADRIITDIEEIANLLRALQNEGVHLTMGQVSELQNLSETYVKEQADSLLKAGIAVTDSKKEELKTQQKSKVDDKEKEMLKAAEEKKFLRKMELLKNLEDKIIASGLPADTKNKLLAVLQEAKTNNWNLTPEVANKIEAIKQEDNTKAQREEEKRIEAEAHASTQEVSGIAVVAAVAAVGAVVLSAKETAHVTDTNQAINFAPQAKIPTEELVMEKAPETFGKMANKAIEAVAKAIQKPAEEVTLDDIQDSKLLTVQKRYARAQYLKSNPDVAQKLKDEVQQIMDKANAKANRRHARKEARRNGQPVPQTSNNKEIYLAFFNNLPDEEKDLFKKVKGIKQRGKLTREEIRQELSTEEAQAYDGLMQKYQEYKREQARMLLVRKLEHKRDLDHQQRTQAVNKETTAHESNRRVQISDNTVLPQQDRMEKPPRINLLAMLLEKKKAMADKLIPKITANDAKGFIPTGTPRKDPKVPANVVVEEVREADGAPLPKRGRMPEAYYNLLHKRQRIRREL